MDGLDRIAARTVETRWFVRSRKPALVFSTAVTTVTTRPTGAHLTVKSSDIRLPPFLSCSLSMLSQSSLELGNGVHVCVCMCVCVFG